MFDFMPESLDADSLLVFRNRTEDYAKLFVPVAGQIVTDGIDTTLPELKAVDEILAEANKYRRPPAYIVEEMKRRFARFFMLIERKAQRHYAESN